MRLIVGMRAKNHVNAADVSAVLRGAVRAAQHGMDRVQPWPSDATRLDLRWVPANGRVAVLFRSNEPESVVEREGWVGNKVRCWAWTGVVGSRLYERLVVTDNSGSEPLEEIRDAVGSFALWGATPDRLTVYTNSHRAEGVYWAETRDVILFSNSAALLNMIKCGGKPEYSAVGVAGFIAHGLPSTNTTLFDGVEIVPSAARLAAYRGADFDLEIDPMVSQNSQVDMSQVVHSVAEGLVSYAQTLTQGASNVVAAITGGKDSRLVVSTLHAAGIDFVMYTNGLKESGEAAVGAQVAAALGVDHKVNFPVVTRNAAGRRVITARPEMQAWQTLRSTGGLGNAFTMLANPMVGHKTIQETVNLGGQGGEIIRGGYLRRTGNTIPDRQLARNVITETWLNNLDLLTPFARQVVASEWKSLYRVADIDPARALFEGYVNNRTGRWLATMRHGESVVNAHTTLLLNNQMVRHLRSLNAVSLLGERVAHRVMRELAPSVVGLPFFRDRWGFEEDGPNDFFSPQNWSDRAPYTAHDQPRADFNWRVGYSSSLAKFFKSYILDSPNSLLFDVVNRDSVEAMLGGKTYRAPAAWALFSVQFVLNNTWLETNAPGGKTVEIEVP